MLAAQHEVQRATAGVAKVAERWRAFAALWKADREGALAKLRQARLLDERVALLIQCLYYCAFCSSHPNAQAERLVSPTPPPHLLPPSLLSVWLCRGRKGIGALALEERMAQYHRLGEEAWAAGGDQDVHFIRVRCVVMEGGAGVGCMLCCIRVGTIQHRTEQPSLTCLPSLAARHLPSTTALHGGGGGGCRCSPVASAVRIEAQAWVRGLAEVMAAADAPQLEALRQQVGQPASQPARPALVVVLGYLCGAVQTCTTTTLQPNRACNRGHGNTGYLPTPFDTCCTSSPSLMCRPPRCWPP